MSLVTGEFGTTEHVQYKLDVNTTCYRMQIRKWLSRVRRFVLCSLPRGIWSVGSSEVGLWESNFSKTWVLLWTSSPTTHHLRLDTSLSQTKDCSGLWSCGQAASIPSMDC